MFPASGAVQNDETVSSFGGVVYSASSDTLRIWTPVPPGPGYLLYISNEWGNTLYPQTSTTATLVVHVWKSTTCKYKGYNMSKKNKFLLILDILNFQFIKNKYIKKLNFIKVYFY